MTQSLVLSLNISKSGDVKTLELLSVSAFNFDITKIALLKLYDVIGNKERRSGRVVLVDAEKEQRNSI